MPIEAVVFDLDGTLFDHRGSVTTALGSWLPGLDSAVTDDLVEAWLRVEERHFPRWRSGEISWAEQRRERLRGFLPLIGWPADDEAGLDAIFAGYLACYEAAWTAFDDAADVVNLLSAEGIWLAVLTNGTILQQNAKIDAIGLSGRLGPVLTAQELGLSKPHPDTYLAACRRLGRSPGRVLHVGDRFDLDVLAPRAAGLQAVHLDRLGGEAQDGERITSLRQLPGYLRTMSAS